MKLDCPSCHSVQTLKIKHGQFANYLECEKCNNKVSEKEVRKGKVIPYTIGEFDIIFYKQPDKAQNTLILFAGSGASAKMHLHKSRIYLNADEKNYNLISISHKSLNFTPYFNYIFLMNELCKKYQLCPSKLSICGFSMGAIPVFKLAENYEFNKIYLISPCLPSIDRHKIIEKNSHSIINFINTKDYEFAPVSKAINNMFSCICYKVDSSHSPNKALQMIFNKAI